MEEHHHTAPVPMKQAWIAFLLTTGEFVVGVWLLLHEGHMLALYLAITYASRETPGGRHYHLIVVKLVKHAKEHYFKRSH